MRILLGVDYNEFLIFYMLASQAYKINEFQDISVGTIFSRKPSSRFIENENPKGSSKTKITSS